MKTPHTHETLTHDLKNLGVELGDTLFIHSSFKSLGPVEGGAGTVVGALEDAVGREGTHLDALVQSLKWKGSAGEDMERRNHAIHSRMAHRVFPPNVRHLSLRPLLPFRCCTGKGCKGICEYASQP